MCWLSFKSQARNNLYEGRVLHERLHMKDLTLYNYMPLRFLRSLFEKGLYFRLASGCADKNEGYFPLLKLSSLNHDIDRFAQYVGYVPTPKLRSEVQNLIGLQLELERQQVFVSCWHQNDNFSPKMYQEYSPGGIYVKTSTWSIQNSIDENTQRLLTFENGSFFTEIKYLDSLDDVSEEDVHRSVLRPVVHDRKDKARWSFEREQRLMIRAVNFALITGLAINGTAIPLATEDLRTDLGSSVITEPDGTQVERIFVRIDPAKLVQSIGMVGKTNAAAVKRLLDEFGIRCPIEVLSEDVLS